MMHRALLVGLLITCTTKEICSKQLGDDKDLIRTEEREGVQQFHKTKDRVLRSTVNCDVTNETRNERATYGTNLTITCACLSSENLNWYDSRCHELHESEHVSFASNSIIIKSFNRNDSLGYTCADIKNGATVCSDKIQLSVVVVVCTTSSYGGVAAIACVIISAIVVIVLCCCWRKQKSKFNLFVRDTFNANDGRDGKDYDAYVSTGYTEIDRKFIEAFITNVLQKKCRYKLLLDNKNILPKLDYSPKLNSTINRCRRLIVVFSPSYMTHDWCMYCFNEGLRKIVDLNIPTIFIITDHTMRAELYAHNDVIAHIPQILLTQYQSPADRQLAIEKIRQRMPPPLKQSASIRKKNGMRSPIMSDAESIHRSDLALNEYTFGVPPQQISEEIEREYDEALEEPGPDEFVTAIREGEDIDPERVQVNQYGARKDFYSLTMNDGDV